VRAGRNRLQVGVIAWIGFPGKARTETDWRANRWAGLGHTLGVEEEAALPNWLCFSATAIDPVGMVLRVICSILLLRDLEFQPIVVALR